MQYVLFQKESFSPVWLPLLEKENCRFTFVSDPLNLRILAGSLTDGSTVIALTCDQAGNREDETLFSRASDLSNEF